MPVPGNEAALSHLSQQGNGTGCGIASQDGRSDTGGQRNVRQVAKLDCLEIGYQVLSRWCALEFYLNQLRRLIAEVLTRMFLCVSPNSLPGFSLTLACGAVPQGKSRLCIGQEHYH